MRTQKILSSQPGKVIRLIPRTCLLAGHAFVCVCLVLISFLEAQPVFAQTGTSVAVDPAAGQLQRSCTELLKIVVNNVPSLYAMDLTIQFDPAIVQVADMDALTAGVQIRQGSFLEKGYVIRNQVDNAAGTIRYAATQIRPQRAKSGSGVLLEIAFSAVALGVSPVTIFNAQLVADGVRIPAAITNGTLEVTSFSPGDNCPATPTPTLEATQTFTATSTPTPSSTATMTRTNTVVPRTKTPIQASLPASTAIPALLASPTSASSPTPATAFTPAQTVEPAREQPDLPTETPLSAAANNPTQACSCAGTAAPVATQAARRGTLSLLLELFGQPQTYLICFPLFLLVLIVILLFHLNFRKESEEETDSEPEVKEMP